MKKGKLPKASLTKELRQFSGESTMMCIKALIVADYNLDEAIFVLKEWGLAVYKKNPKYPKHSEVEIEK